MEVKVWLFKPKNRAFYQLEWKDPATGKTHRESTKRKTQAEAALVAKRKEDELNGLVKATVRITWSEFRKRFEQDLDVRDTTRAKYTTVFNLVEELQGPQLLRQLDVRAFTKALGKGTRSAGTIASHLRHLKAALRWAANHEPPLLASVPKIKMPKQPDRAKGRPLTDFELNSFYQVAEKHGPEWKLFVQGLVLSGLRLEEALLLTLDARPDNLYVDCSGKHVKIWIPAELQKSDRMEWLPVIPEFAELLLAMPHRKGPVFKLPYRRLDTVSKIIGRFGKAAKILVAADKYASAHDLRRTFCDKLALNPRITPAMLQRLARHASLETTMAFYAGRNTETLSEAVAAAFSDTLPDIWQNGAEPESTESLSA